MNVIITGCNRGIGKALVEAFVSAGYNVWACARKANPEYDPENNPSVPATIIDENLWTSIGTDDQCFEGTLHGDGYTISGLSSSLFYNLCVDVYNLGVTGSFTSAGVVDKGNGYVESSWISSSSAPAAGTKPVFGNPSRTGDVLTEKGKIQI